MNNTKKTDQPKTPHHYCEHGIPRDDCAVCLTEELIAMREFGFLHHRPDGSVAIMKLGDESDGF